MAGDLWSMQCAGGGVGGGGVGGWGLNDHEICATKTFIIAKLLNNSEHTSYELTIFLYFRFSLATAFLTSSTNTLPSLAAATKSSSNFSTVLGSNGSSI